MESDGGGGGVGESQRDGGVSHCVIGGVVGAASRTIHSFILRPAPMPTEMSMRCAGASAFLVVVVVVVVMIVVIVAAILAYCYCGLLGRCCSVPVIGRDGGGRAMSFCFLLSAFFLSLFFVFVSSQVNKNTRFM